MLKVIRVSLAVLSLLAVTLLFVDFTGTAASLWPWMAKIQFMPALLSINILALVIILAMTLLLGRVYCSVICPLGILQDVINWVRTHTGSKKGRMKRLRYTEAHTRIRLVVLTVFVILVVLGLTNLLFAAIAGLIEPYSAYGRIASQIFAPGYDAVNNVLADWSASRPANYMFYQVAYAVSVPVLVVAIITLITVVVFAWRGGRDYCNTICPVGTILGYLSRYSLLKVTIDTSKCINCGKCARHCKAKCIDSKHHAIDYTRCVACFDCINTCNEGAIRYTWRRGNTGKMPVLHDDPVSAGRSGFVSATAFAIGATAMHTLAKTTDGGLVDLKVKQTPKRQVGIVPAGAVSHRHLSQHCTGCQLCIQSCPSHILRPSLELDTFMQPTIDYTQGYCDTSCTKCSNICPVGAFHPVDEAEKSSIKVGTAVVDLTTCISAADGNHCGNCARHCPAGAITMVAVNPDEPRGNRMPVVNAEACIGCGECEYYCPVGTVASMEASTSAIHVEGIEVHRQI